jgi:hypothetical protein
MAIAEQLVSLQMLTDTRRVKQFSLMSDCASLAGLGGVCSPNLNIVLLPGSVSYLVLPECIVFLPEKREQYCAEIEGKLYPMDGWG